MVNISRAADCPGWCPATGAGRPPRWNPAQTDAGAGTSLPIISGRAVSRRHDAPAPQAGPSCPQDVEQGSGRPGRLLQGEANSDSSGAEKREAPGWDYSCCVDGVRRRPQQSPGLVGFAALLLEEGTTTKKKKKKIKYQQCEISRYGLRLLICWPCFLYSTALWVCINFNRRSLILECSCAKLLSIPVVIRW